MGKAIKLLVYIPAFNEESHIEHVIRQIPKSIDGIHSVDSLVIDDGSSDNTAGVAISAGAHVISHGRNQGVGMAFQSAVQFAWDNDYAILVGIDADDVEDGDVLLDWKAEQATTQNIGYRYVHIFQQEELTELAEQNGFSINTSYYSDGKEGNIGLYQIWEKISENK